MPRLLPLHARRRHRAPPQDLPECPVLPLAMHGDAKNLRIGKVLFAIFLGAELLRSLLVAFDLRHGFFYQTSWLIVGYPGILVMVPLCWRLWRRLLFRLTRSCPGDRFVYLPAFLLGGVLLGELAYFELGTSRGGWPRYSPTWPAFLAGPVIAFLSGWVAMRRQDFPHA